MTAAAGRTLHLALAFAAIMATGSAAAQPALRIEAVSTGGAWRHAGTGMVLPVRAAGFVRGDLRDNSANEFIVTTTYADRDAGVDADVRLYLTMAPSIPLWFDNALGTIMSPQPGAAAPAVTAFAPPGASTASGLRATTAGGVPGIRSIAIAIAPLRSEGSVSSWFIEIRLSSARLDPAALNDRLGAFIAALGWPAETWPARVAVPVRPCAAPLQLMTARRDNRRPHDVVTNSTEWAMAPHWQASSPRRAVCRESGDADRLRIYRLEGTADSYLIPLADGIALAAGEEFDLRALMGQGRRPRMRYSVSIFERRAIAAYASFDRLPPPNQAWETAMTAPSLLSIISGGSGR